jgi:hypothetical protein
MDNTHYSSPSSITRVRGGLVAVYFIHMKSQLISSKVYRRQNKTHSERIKFSSQLITCDNNYSCPAHQSTLRNTNCSTYLSEQIYASIMVCILLHVIYEMI